MTARSLRGRGLCILFVCATCACAPVDPVTGYPVDDRDHGGEIHVGRARATPTTAVSTAQRPRVTPGPSAPAPSPVGSDAAAPPTGTPPLETQDGDATWYSDSLAGGPTASGERYSPRALTAAHRRFPLGTWVRVTRRDTGAHVVVRVNDRGPFGSERRIIDLSRRAAEELRMIRRGVAPVRLEVLRYGEGRRRRERRRR